MNDILYNFLLQIPYKSNLFLIYIFAVFSNIFGVYTFNQRIWDKEEDREEDKYLCVNIGRP